MRTFFILSTLAALGGTSLAYASDNCFKQASGNGATVHEVRTVARLTNLDVVNSASADILVDVRVGGTPGLEVEADSNLIPLIHTDSNGDTLKIWTDRSLHSCHPVRITYTVPVLSKLSSQGSGDVRMQGLNGGAFEVANHGSMDTELIGRVGDLQLTEQGSGDIDATRLESGSVNVTVSGSGSVALGKVTGEQFKVLVRGSGDVSAAGNVRNLDLSVNGSGDVDLKSLQSESARLDTNGSGDIEVAVSRKIVARSNGSGEVTIHGNPAQRDVYGRNISMVQ